MLFVHLLSIENLSLFDKKAVLRATVAFNRFVALVPWTCTVAVELNENA